MAILAISLIGWSALVSPQPSAPSQPVSGPGGSDYKHNGVKETVYGMGEKQFWIYEPTNPTPSSAPIIVFNHGWAATEPIIYRAWINHLVRKGNIVIYPRYQENIATPSDNFTPNAINATLEAIRELETGDHVRPELDKFAIIGHSAGGLISINMAALADEKGLPNPKAVFAVEPGRSRSTEDQVGPLLANLEKIPSNTLLLTLAGDRDDWVGNNDSIRIIKDTPQIPNENKDYLLFISDTTGNPPLLGDHFFPLAAQVTGTNYNFQLLVDARDYYATWKLADGLLDAAFFGVNREYALGNTSQQRFMGLWSNGRPVKELEVIEV